MPRYYQANVQDISGQLLAASIGQAFQNFRQAKERKAAEKVAAEQREMQMLPLAMQGIRQGTAPMEAAVPTPRMEGGKIVGVEAAPERYTQLTPGFYQDTQVMATRAREERERAMADTLAKEMAKVQAQQAANPVGFQLNQDKLRAEVERLKNPTPDPVRQTTVTLNDGVYAFNPVTGARGQRIGDRPVSVSDTTSTNWHTVQTDQGTMQVNPKTGESRPVLAPGGGPLRAKPPAQIAQAVTGNQRQLKAIDDAIASLEQNPKSVGLRFNWMPDALAQVVDPNGVITRAGVSDVGSLLIHDRTGAAMNASESVRLKPFIPGPGDQSAAAIQKLRRLKTLLAEDTDFLRQQYGIGNTPTPFVPNDQPRYSPDNPFAPRR